MRLRRFLYILAIAGGCTELEPELGSSVERGEHVEVWASDGIEVCGGNVAYMDQFIDRFRELAGPRPEAEFHRYYLLDDEDYAESGCPSTSRGCVRASQTIYTSGLMPSIHEVVHAEIFGSHDGIFEEGIAVMYGDPEPRGYPIRGTIDEGLDIKSYRIPYDIYPLAGYFSRFLVDRWGLRSFLAVRDATSAQSDYQDVASAFRAVLSVDLDDEILDFENAAPSPASCVNAGYRVPLVECGIEPTMWKDDQSFVESVELACDSAEVLGPYHGEMFVYKAVEIDELAHYDIEYKAWGAPTATAWITKCDSECSRLPREGREYPFEPSLTFIQIADSEVRSHLLYPGKYWVRLARPIELPGNATLTITKNPN